MKSIKLMRFRENTDVICASCGQPVLEYMTYHLSDTPPKSVFHLKAQPVYESADEAYIPAIPKQAGNVYFCYSCWEKLKATMHKEEIIKTYG